METVLYAPFAARIKELLVITGSQVETGAALVRLEPVGDGDRGGRRRGRRPRRSTCPSPQERSAARGARRPGASQPDRRRPRVRRPAARTRTARSTTTSPIRDELQAQGVSVVADEMDLLGTFADLAELSRNRPGRRGAADRAAGAQLQGALPHLPAEPRRRARRAARAVPRPAAAGAAPLRRRGPRAHARAGAGGLPDLPGPAALGTRGRAWRRRCSAAGSTSRRRPATWPPRPRPARAARPGHPAALPGRSATSRAACGSAGSTSRRSTPSAPTCWLAVRDELTALAADGSLADHSERIEALAAIPEQIVRFLAERLEGGVPAKEPMLEVLVRRHYREFDLHDLHTIENGRPFVVADYTLDDRPTRRGVDGRHHGRARRPGRRPGRRGRRATSPSGVPATRPWSTSTCTGPRLPSRPTR